MSAHQFLNTPILIVVFNKQSHYENYCQCGHRVSGASAELTVQEQVIHVLRNAQ